MDKLTLQTIQLGGLLHDIGKFLQRGKFPGMDVSGKHPEVSARFIDTFKDTFSRYTDLEMLRELVLKHHENSVYPDELQVRNASAELKPLCSIISQADNYSSSERDDMRQGQNYKKTPLASVFARLQLDSEKPKPEPNYYQPGSLQADNCFPKSLEEINRDFSAKYNELLQNFAEKFKTLTGESDLEFPVFYNRLMALFQEFTWVTPSSTMDEIPDISLFDHLKTTAAIATAMYIYHSEKHTLTDEKAIYNKSDNKFRLIVGDLSGIQDFIFAGFAYTAKGAAKTLRARSFLLSALSEVIAGIILERFELNPVNIIMASGGKFYILIANTGECEDKLVQLQKEIDDMLMRRFKGEVCLNIGHIAFSGKDFESFQQVVERIGQVLNRRKNRPFEQVLKTRQKWEEAEFIRPLAGTTGETICHGCGKAFASFYDDNVPICNECNVERDLGRDLAKANYIYFYKEPRNKADKFNLIGDYYLIATKEPMIVQTDNPWWVLRLNNTDLSGLSFPAGFRFTANHITMEGDLPRTFEDIAKHSKGRRLLGYLKADVDNLGSLFACGLQDEDDSRYVSISRVTTMSRMLDLFFAGYINKLLVKDYSNCYSVFSGGDDLLLIGPWHEIIDLAVQIHNDFTFFVNQNPNVTLSMGINSVKPRSSIDCSAEMAEEFLESAKEKPAFESDESRNQIFVFGCIMKWSDFESGLSEAKYLASLKPDPSFLYRLWEYQIMYMDYRKNANVEGFRYLPLLHYDLARNFKENHPIRRWCEEKLFTFTPKKVTTIDNMGFILQYVINSQREE